MKRKNSLVWIVVILIIALGVFMFYRSGATNNYNYGDSGQQGTQTQNNQQAPAIGVANNTSTSQPASSSQGKKYTLDAKNFQFTPQTLTLNVGDSITWTNGDQATHTVTSNSGNIFNSGYLQPGQSYTFTFNTSGVYNYYCQMHPSMRGVITVN